MASSEGHELHGTGVEKMPCNAYRVIMLGLIPPKFRHFILGFTCAKEREH